MCDGKKRLQERRRGEVCRGYPDGGGRTIAGYGRNDEEERDVRVEESSDATRVDNGEADGGDLYGLKNGAGGGRYGEKNGFNKRRLEKRLGSPKGFTSAINPGFGDMEDDNERGRRSNRLKVKRSSKISNNDDTTIVNDCVVEGERTPEETAVVAKNKKKPCAKSGPPCSENTSLNQQEVHEQNKRPKTIPESNVMARQPAGKPKMVTTSSGVRVILPSFTSNTTRKSPKKDKSNKSTDTRKSSKSPVKKKSSKSTVSVTSTETIEGAVVVESTRKTRSKTREPTVQRVSKKTKHGKGMDTGPAECSYTPSTSKAKIVKKKVVGTPIGGIDLQTTDQVPSAKSVKASWRGQFPGKRVRISDVMKKFVVERTRPAICVWNMELLHRREYLELTDRGFGTWPLLVQGDVADDENRTNSVFAERSTSLKVFSKTKLQALQRLFNTEDGDTGGSDQEQNNEHVFKTPTRTKDSKQDQPTRITDNDPTPNESVGLDQVYHLKLTRTSPTTIMAIDNSCIDYCKKRRIDRDEIPKFDLGISPERKPVSPLPISSIIPITKGVFSLNSRVKAICDAPRLGKREAKPGEALRSPYIKRTVDINTSETSSEKKICAWINVVVEPVWQCTIAVNLSLRPLQVQSL
ncbi:hypothetical protein L6452_35877 [Arctium lappa]|uniref:Uncharacterized protein n=1 Tax=Arctium lappa TaxID=4217 RepID=A0ACB8Y716_ARCLA|nr:hypothetical protein L6452_35877 [Arctium lappa]